MKIISFAVPCFNSAEYMERCVDSLLPAGERAEIILINDGSTDRTGEICDLYKRKYPDIIRVVHQENGGHGEGVNQGLERAGGVYFKVVDSDDWTDARSLERLMEKLEEQVASGSPVDLMIANYVYENESYARPNTVRYTNVFPTDTTFTWKDIGRFRISQYLLMHAVFYRTQVLRDCGLKLPKHTFYVDNIFVYTPLPFVKTLYYSDIDFYHYYIGRETQSVNEAVMLRQLEQQIAITKIMIESHCLKAVAESEPELAAYMRHYISIMVAICSVFFLLGDSEECEEEKAALWEFIRTRDETLYRRLRYRSLSAGLLLPGRLGRRIGLGGYRLAKRLYKFS